ncbi:MAG: DUF1559 domain-containing protein [Pirellulales bacterium]|nr:DUF1559 domain-containing protein [Pirellulales bacterium]
MMVEPDALQNVDNCNNNLFENPSVSSGVRALFNINVARSFKNIEDGTSNTVAFSELIQGSNVMARGTAAGVNASLADGAVRFFSDNIDPVVWRAFGSINGNEVDN